MFGFHIRFFTNMFERLKVFNYLQNLNFCFSLGVLSIFKPADLFHYNPCNSNYYSSRYV